MASHHAASDDIANALRDVVEHELHSPAAIKYQHQPNKLGRPFKLTVPILGGKPLSLSTWKGKVILIDFWATWCPPCRASLPGLAALYQQNHDKGFEVLGISNDYDIADLKQFLAQNKDIAWPQSFNPAGPNRWHNLAVTLGIDAIPTSYLIDRNGILRNIQIGIPEEKIKKLLDQPAKPDSPTDTSAKK
jgi:thiol-disulfide isomerase/thioredoxin